MIVWMLCFRMLTYMSWDDPVLLPFLSLKHNKLASIVMFLDFFSQFKVFDLIYSLTLNCAYFTTKLTILDWKRIHFLQKRVQKKFPPHSAQRNILPRYVRQLLHADHYKSKYATDMYRNWEDLFLKLFEKRETLLTIRYLLLELTDICGENGFHQLVQEQFEIKSHSNFQSKMIRI